VPTDTVPVDQLKQISTDLRVDIIEMLLEAGSGHPGGSLSEIDMLTCLYLGGVLDVDPKNPDKPDRDRFILGKAHCTPGMYSTLAKAGFIPRDELRTFRTFGARLQGHVDRLRIPGIEFSGGSLGQGLSAAVGMALAARVKGETWRVWCMNGDGETQEGQVWEAILFAGNERLDNLTLIIDANQVQQTGPTAEIQDLDPMKAKFEAFKWHAIEVDGHDHAAFLKACDEAKSTKGKPTAIIARTVKGKGVSWMELDYNWHGKAPNAEQAERAIAEIKGGN
jgi:transketolase